MQHITKTPTNTKEGQTAKEAENEKMLQSSHGYFGQPQTRITNPQNR